MATEPEQSSMVTVSVVSHGHGDLVSSLCDDLARCPQVARVVVTLNVPEPGLATALSGRAELIRNERAKGFGANHNAAFRSSTSRYFAVVNPDVRLGTNPFPELLACLGDPGVAMCAPAVVSPQGAREDSARHFPTLPGLIRKAFGGHDGRIAQPPGDAPFPTPWVAGMFMLFRAQDFAVIGGFDEGFFLYYEDVDLCARLWHEGRAVMCCPAVSVIHDARRASRRSVRHMAWHAGSMARYFRKHPWPPRLERR